ncbi:MAG: type II toxin-antitoxin system ParD family antitoxin [Deltaproteobacteria bacterium]|nr:type II toxin-antitoxin system ParD family antitoxin [Deltaproteobacteria bacterium]
MHISLPEPMEAIINKQVETGMYTSASEVIREAVRVWLKHNRNYESEEMQLARLQGKIDSARKQLERGEGEPFTEKTIEDIKRRGMERLSKK